jgi:competence protein ComEA
MASMSASDETRSAQTLVNKYKTSIVIALLGFVILGVGILIPKLNLFESEPKFISAEESAVQSVSTIKVDVSGAIKAPMVYELEGGSRVSDAIESAGGLTKKADKSWVAQNINLAQIIADGTKIYIPSVGEIKQSSTLSGSSLGLDTESVSGSVNINTATSSELDTLPQIGPVTAQKIIDGRPYSSVEDLSNKKVLGPKTYEGVKDLVRVQ